MNRVNIIISAALSLVIAAVGTGCKTTEQNYRNAYEIAKAKSDESSGIENTIYDKIRREAVASRLVTARGDSLPTMTVGVQCTPGGFSTPDSVKQYSLAVAQFKQVFNAKSLASRLRSGSWPNAMVLQTAEPLYYVIVSTSADVSEIAEDYKRLMSEKPLAMKEPYPWILMPSRLPLTMGK